MKGYLQRMVTGVARSERAVHPLVGGMFLRGGQQEIVEETEIVSAPKGTGRNGSSSLERRGVREPAMPERAEILPLVEDGAERGLRIDEAQRWSSAEEAEAKSSARGEEYREDQVAAGERQTNMPVQVRNLLVRDDVQRKSEVRADSQIIEASDFGENLEPLRVVRQSPERVVAERVARQRGSEDIQIHIGRVEVIAVPPPVQRAAPAATRKAESLEEYLRRRDRRAR